MKQKQKRLPNFHLLALSVHALTPSRGVSTGIEGLCLCVLLCMSVSVCDVLLDVTGYIAGVAERRGNLFVQVLVQK